MRPRPGTSTPRCCPVRERVLGAEHPHTLAARQPRPLDRGGGGCGRGPGPVRRAAPGAGTGLRRRAPGHADHLRTAWPAGPGRRGMRPGPGTCSPRCCPASERVLGAEHPDTLTARADLARWTGEAGDAAGARDQYAALVPVRERVRAPSTPTPWPPAATWLAGPGRRGMRPRPVTSSPRWCPSGSGSWALSTPRP